jgi:replicative DNA helicase
MDKISTFTLRTLPQHLDSEKALIGAVLVRPESIHDVVDIVSPDIFFSERHRLIWETIQELFSKSEPIDLLSLSSRLEEKSQLDRAGGTSYLAELAGSIIKRVWLQYIPQEHF